MKKLLLIIVTAAICSLSYSNDFRISFLVDTFYFSFNDTKADLIEKNSIDPISVSDNKIIYETEFNSWYHTFPTDISFDIVDGSIENVTVLFLTKMDTIIYTLMIDQINSIFGDYSHLSIECNENDTILPINAYTLIKNEQYQFTQIYDFQNFNCYFFGCGDKETPYLFLQINNKPLKYEDEIEILPFN